MSTLNSFFRALAKRVVRFNKCANIVRINKSFLHSRKYDSGERHLFLNGIKFDLTDYRFPLGQNEDKLYNDAKLRGILPRGYAVVKVGNEIVGFISGHPKFGYEGDYPSSTNASSWIAVTKENGECGHIGAFIYEGIKYFIVGSKNVHLIVREAHFMEDLTNPQYLGERYSFARKIAKLFLEKYQHTFQRVHSFIVDNCVTLCCESIFLDSQHLVDYRKDGDSLRFFAITYQRENADSPMTWCNPIIAQHHFLHLKLDIVTNITEISNQSDLEAIKEVISKQPNSEGAVINCLDESGNVIYVYKHKNDIYVFWRAVREQMRKKASLKAFLKRLLNLHVHPENEGALIKRALEFYGYFLAQSTSNQESFFSNWVVWMERFDALSLEEQLSYSIDKTDVSSKKKPIVFLFVGIQGSGKSTCARLLENILRFLGFKVRHLEQDMYDGPKKKQLYHKAIEQSMSDEKLDFLILSKMNHTVQIRDEMRTILEDAEMYFLSFLLKEKEFYVSRIQSRANAHRGLFYNEDTMGIIEMTLGAYEPLSELEMSLTPTLELDSEASKFEILNVVFEFIIHHGVIDPLPELFIQEHFEEALSRVNKDDLRMSTESMQKAAKAPVAKAPAAKAQKERHPLYDCIKVVLNGVDFGLPENPKLVCLQKHHLTLNYYGGKKPGNSHFVDDAEVNVTIVGYVQDERATVLSCKVDGYVVESGFPHITYALVSGEKPAYSLSLLKLSPITLFENPIVISGRTFREM